MKRLLLGMMLGGLAVLAADPTTADVDVHVAVALPPPIVFAGPPHVVVVPETYVYVVPDLDVDVFFYDGWWWRPWEGRWYRSRNYHSAWVYYKGVPEFHASIPPGWRNDYRNRVWKGLPWNHKPIPEKQLRQNWRSWQQGKHWEKHNTWGVAGLKPPKHPPKAPKAPKPKPTPRPKKGR